MVLNLNQLTKLAKAITRANTDGKSLDPLVPFRLAVLSNSTLELMAPRWWRVLLGVA
jgi:hypothetical protein